MCSPFCFSGPLAERGQRLDPLRVVVKAWHQGQLFAPRLDELLAAAVADFLQGLDAIGDEGRAHHQQLLRAGLGQLVEARQLPQG